MVKANEMKKQVKERYGEIASQSKRGCSSSRCCASPGLAEELSRHVGYSEAEIDSVPKGANLGLGCGNPVALASLKEGDTVLDLGSGAGFDAFLAAQRVGKTGHVIGVDMTPEMLEKARTNAEKGGFGNVEFRMGEIEKLPVEDQSVDVILSNCVINLSPDKASVFKEALRVLKPGGRLMVSDLVLTQDLPKNIRKSIEAYVGCIAGAIHKSEYLKLMSMAGFVDISVVGESSYPVDAMFEGLESAADAVVSIKVSAQKKEAGGAQK
ncbi:MAG: arsenite methyltransferase [Candidatus Omnitrophota bacterium]|jgi:SAM-dependent methyltransferase